MSHFQIPKLEGLDDIRLACTAPSNQNSQWIEVDRNVTQTLEVPNVKALNHSGPAILIGPSVKFSSNYIGHFSCDKPLSGDSPSLSQRREQFPDTVGLRPLELFQ